MDQNTLTQQQQKWIEEVSNKWSLEITSHLWHQDHTITAHGGAAFSVVCSTLAVLSAWLNRPYSDDKQPLTADNSSAKNIKHSEEYSQDEYLQVESIEEAERKISLNPPRLGSTLYLAEDTLPIAQIWADLPVTWLDLRLMWEQLYATIVWKSREPGSPYENYETAENWLINLSSETADVRVEHLENQADSRGEETLFNQHLAGRFLANASHEIRTPLTAVLGFAELLMEDTYGALTADQQTAVGHIENSAQNLLEIINNMLDLLHIRAGKLTLHFRTLDSAVVLKDIYKILLPLANRKNVQFTIEIPDDLGTIDADENIFRHIVYHLLASALRATPAKGKVFLTASRTAKNLLITTHDTALHLPPEALHNMMEPYPLLENSPTRGYEGWEVGLPLVLRYIELQSGSMKIESLPEDGTKFYITLPLEHTIASQ